MTQTVSLRKMTAKMKKINSSRNSMNLIANPQILSSISRLVSSRTLAMIMLVLFSILKEESQRKTSNTNLQRSLQISKTGSKMIPMADLSLSRKGEVMVF